MYISRPRKKQGNKTYTTTLIRESYREKGKVKTRTICNITNLDPQLILMIENYLKGNKGEFNLSDLELGSSVEYAGSFVIKQFAAQLGLDKIISAKKTQWREDILAVITGRILYQGSKLSLINKYKDSVIWELAGHEHNSRPDVKKNCYQPMDMLIQRKNRIDIKLAKKHLTDGCIVLYDMTNTWLEGEYENSEIITYGKPKGGKRGYKQVAIGLLTDKDGCPVAVEVFKGSTSDQTTVLDQIKKISKKYGISNAVFVGDRGMLTQKRIEEVQKTDFKIITAMTHKEMRGLVDKESLQLDLFDEMNITEVIDSENPDMRYMLCKNENEMVKERATREALISKVSALSTKKALVKRKRDPLKVAASVGRIFEKKRVEKFFNWSVGERGELEWSLKEDVIAKEAELDGCYVIKTDVDKEILDKEEVVNCYRGLQKVEQAFKNMKTVALELRPLYHKSDERIESHIFIVMLAYYIQWHMMQKLKPLFEKDGVGENKRWSFKTVIDRLMSIQRTECLISGVVVKNEISKPDEEQSEILNLLGVELM
jgi:transposase